MGHGTQRRGEGADGPDGQTVTYESKNGTITVKRHFGNERGAEAV